MRRLYYSEDNRGVWLSVLMVVIRLILVLWPGHVMTTAVKVLGIALLAGGGILILSWYRGRMKGVDALTLAEGILLAALGLFVLMKPKMIISIIPFAVGAVVLVNGVLNLAQALDQRRENYSRWELSLALAVLTMVLGLLIMFNPFSTMEMLVVAIGGVSIYNGASNLFIEAGYRKLFK